MAKPFNCKSLVEADLLVPFTRFGGPIQPALRRCSRFTPKLPVKYTCPFYRLVPYSQTGLSYYYIYYSQFLFPLLTVVISTQVSMCGLVCSRPSRQCRNRRGTPFICMERRKVNRYVLEVPCFVSRVPRNGRYVAGQTVNVSRSGILIRQTATPCGELQFAPGDAVEIDLELPPNPRLNMQRSLWCRGAAVGIRAGARGETYLAVSVYQMQFRDLPEHFHGLAGEAPVPELVM